MTKEEFVVRLRELIVSMPDSADTDSLMLDVFVNLGYQDVELNRERHYSGWRPRKED